LKEALLGLIPLTPIRALFAKVARQWILVAAVLPTPIKKQQITSMKHNLLCRMEIQKEHRGIWIWLNRR
jgi:hypothetical protein